MLSNTDSVVEEDTTKQITMRVREGLMELKQAYPAVLNRLRETLLAELQVPNASSSMLAELRDRAENIRELGGDHRLEAFIVRLAGFNGHGADMENLAGMAVNKPPRQWVDADIDRAALELARYGAAICTRRGIRACERAPRQAARHGSCGWYGRSSDPGP